MKYFLSNCIASICLIVLMMSCDNTEDISSSMQLENDASFTKAQAQKGGVKEKCATIQSGTIVDDNGETITTGFNDEGYNYQAQTYSGEPYPGGEWAGWYLNSKWNDAWLSTQDCDGDGLLDSRYGYDSYQGSGAWKTEHWTYKHTDADGKLCTVKIYKKIIAVPLDAVLVNRIYYDAGQNEIGQYILPGFALVQSIYNDPCGGENGVYYKSPGPIGLGNR